MIKENSHKYSVSAMCIVLGVPRSSYYYELNQLEQETEDEMTPYIKIIFKKSRGNYGTRKIKVELKKQGLIVSRRRISRIMKKHGLVSKYTIAQFKVHSTNCNESKIANELNREFNQHQHLNVVVGDLTYVRVRDKWNYICLFIDLFNREIIGFSVGAHKDARLVYEALSSIKGNLNNINIFHTDRGNEFKNNLIDEALETFNIKRSLSMKGCPYDNAVAEATFKIIKTEFLNGENFPSLEELKLHCQDYINWFNHFRIHGTLGYLSPVQYKQSNLKKVV